MTVTTVLVTRDTTVENVKIDMTPTEDDIEVALLLQKEIGLANIGAGTKIMEGSKMDIGKGKVKIDVTPTGEDIEVALLP